MPTILRWEKELAARRFAVWMAVGAAFVLGLAASEYSYAVTPISLSGWLQLAALAILVTGLVSVGARGLGTARYRLRLLNVGASPLSAKQAASSLDRTRQCKSPIPFPVIAKK